MAKTIHRASRTLTIIDGEVVGAVTVRVTTSRPVLSFDVRADAPDSVGVPRRVVATVVYPIGESDPWNESTLPCEGERVLVIGVTRRRFFRSAGATASRTEVEARTLVMGNDRRRAKVLRQALEWPSG